MGCYVLEGGRAEGKGVAGSPGEEGCPVERPGYQMGRDSWGLAVHVMGRVLQEDVFDSPLSTWKLLMVPNLTAGKKETGVNESSFLQRAHLMKSDNKLIPSRDHLSYFKQIGLLPNYDIEHQATQQISK